MVSRSVTMMLVTLAMLIPWEAAGQEEVTSGASRYRLREMSTGYYEQYEVKPFGQSPFIQAPGVTRRGMRYRTDDQHAWNRKFMADAHQGIPFYSKRTCQECHARESRDPIHGVRANITCRQCHGGEPISSINHYYSPMNPIRRHAYVCAKCHEGASASFATYVVHEPNPASVGTRDVFPALFYAFWVMVGLAGLTFVVFLPHTALWGIRELFVKKEKVSDERESE